MAVVTGVLLDHVEDDPAQAGGTTVWPGPGGEVVEASIGQRLGGAFVGAGDGVFHSARSCSGLSSAAVRHSQSGSDFQSIASHGGE